LLFRFKSLLYTTKKKKKNKQTNTQHMKKCLQKKVFGVSFSF